MVDVRKAILSIFETLQEDLYVLMRIETLVALVTVMFLVLVFLDIFQSQYRSLSFFTTIDTVSDHIVFYLLGAMSSADFQKQLFPVWALVLVSLRVSLGYLSGYGLMDHKRRLDVVSNVVKLMGSGILNGTRGVGFAMPLWCLWAVLQIRSVYRYIAHAGAVTSLWHGRSSEFLPEYLRKHYLADVDKQLNKLLVYGESKQKINIRKPQYSIYLDITKPESLITLNKIKSTCSDNNPPLRSRDRSRYNDMSLAFSLSRLLRCRLEDVPLHSDIIARTRELIVSEIIEQADHGIGAGRAFKILELELSFVRDYFYSLYPVVFWQGLCSLSFSLLLSITTFAVALWLAVDIRSLYESTKEEEEVTLLVGSVNVDVIATWVFMFFMTSKEVWEMLTYLLSNWTRLLLMCKFVRSQCWIFGNASLTIDVTSSFFTSKIVNPWHRKLNQYEFLQSCTYKPTFWKLVHSATLGKSPRKFDGRESGFPIKIHQCVLEAVHQELCRFILEPRSELLYRHNPSLRDPEIFDRYEWALSKLSKCSQSILVWNIATSLCEIKLAQDKGIDLRKPNFLRSVWLWFKTWVCCSSHEFLFDEGISRLEGTLQTNYRIANSLSRYCGYLLAFPSELLPDSFIVPDVIFDTTLNQATEKLKHCDSTSCNYNALMALALEPPDVEHGILNMDIVKQGARLARDLINKETEGVRWEILAGVWTKLLVNIAPSWNAQAHKNSIESGGEFITLIWALLWHCGIEKSSMWHEERAPENTAPTPPQTRDPHIADEGNENETETSDEAHTDVNRQRSHRNAHTEIREEQTQIESRARDIASPSVSAN